MKHDARFIGIGPAGIQHLKFGSFCALGHFLRKRVTSIGTHNAIVLFIASLKKADMTVLSELLEDGRVVPVIDRRYDLDGVPEALQYIEHGHARATVAVRIS
jgi:NADPH:quinone reductase-like Zn-dependent oxidoreductase